MSYVPHPQTEPLVRRPEREATGPQLDDEAARNRTSALIPAGQGSNTPGLVDAPAPGLSPQASASVCQEPFEDRKGTERRDSDDEVTPKGPLIAVSEI